MLVCPGGPPSPRARRGSASRTIDIFSMALTGPPSRQGGWLHLGVARAAEGADGRVHARRGRRPRRRTRSARRTGRRRRARRARRTRRRRPRSTPRPCRCRRRRRRPDVRRAGATSRAAKSMPPMPPFMSQLPRPYRRPSRTSGLCGVRGPLADRLGRDGVDVAVEQQGAAAARAAQARDELRPPGEVEAVRHEAVARARGFRLPDVGLGFEPARAEPPGTSAARPPGAGGRPGYAPSCRRRRGRRRGRRARPRGRGRRRRRAPRGRSGRRGGAWGLLLRAGAGATAVSGGPPPDRETRAGDGPARVSPAVNG